MDDKFCVAFVSISLSALATKSFNILTRAAYNNVLTVKYYLTVQIFTYILMPLKVDHFKHYTEILYCYKG